MKKKLRSQLFTLLGELNTDRFGRDAQIALHVRALLLNLSRTVWQRATLQAKRETHQRRLSSVRLSELFQLLPRIFEGIRLLPQRVSAREIVRGARGGAIS